MLLGFASPEAQRHVRRAAELDPSSAEHLVWLGVAHQAAGEFEQELVAYRRARELDPLWFRPVRDLAVATAEMGDPAGAEAIARRGFRGDAVSQHMLLGRIAATFGDFSEAARHWAIVAAAKSQRWSLPAEELVREALLMAGLGDKPSAPSPASIAPDLRQTVMRIWMETPPDPAVWRARNRSRIAADLYREDNHVAAKLMLNGGRAGELVSTYDSPVDLLGIRAGDPVRADLVDEAPIVALALRQAGRNGEADRLLRQADTAIRAVRRHGRAPFWFDADAAAVLAVQGRGDEALAMLERAIGRGWTHAGGTDLPDIADEPAFRSLHGRPRFERIRARLAAHYARERRETARLRL
jgi:tetratricopeptide (TPR) repeat protein